MRLLTRFSAILLALVSIPANASLIGDTIYGVGQIGLNSFFNGASLVQDPGREFSVPVSTGFSTIFADFTGDELTVGYEANMPANVHHTLGAPFHFSFTDLDWIGVSGQITGLTLLGASPSGLPIGTTQWLADPATWSINTTSDSIVINTVGSVSLATFGAGPSFQQAFAKFRIETVHQVVPEPSVIALLIVGLLSLRLARSGGTGD